MEAINWTTRTERKIEEERDGRQKGTTKGEIKVGQSCEKQKEQRIISGE